MPTIWGTHYTPDELRRKTGTMAQIAGIRLSELSEGKARGLRTAEVHTGSGFRFQVFLDRALDIGAAEFGGIPIAWLSPSLSAPEFYDPQGTAWDRTWGGGWMSTCGLTHFGQPEIDQGEQLGTHGRIAHLRAEKTWVREEWVDDDYLLQLGGQTRQMAPFAEHLLLTRTITTKLGSSSLLVEDVVTNEGFRPTPHMLLYHCNFGFPVVSPDSELLLNCESTRPRDAAAAAGMGHERRFEEPDPDYPEQVFFHLPKTGVDGLVRAAIVNRSLNFGAFVRYRAAELPRFAEWKMMGAGDYVVALEPANQWETPRSQLREEGKLRYLAPGESVHYRLELGVLSGADAIAKFESDMTAFAE